MNYSIDVFYSYKTIYTNIIPELNVFIRETATNKKKTKKNTPSQHNWLMEQGNGKSDKFRTILNKLSKSNTDILFNQIVGLGIGKGEGGGGEVIECIDILFSKAINENNFIKNYAIIASKMNQLQFLNSPPFKTLLLEKCQKMFMEAITLEKELEGYTTANFKYKEQILSCIEFIGELYNQNLIIHKIVQTCFSMIFGRVEVGGVYSVDILSCFTKVVINKFSTIGSDGKTLFNKLDILAKEMKNPKEKFKLMDILDMRKKLKIEV